MHIRVLSAAAALLSIQLLFALAPQPADAQEYAWCGYVPLVQGPQQSCTFSTLEQCRAFVSPSGYCDRNPRAGLARARTVPVERPPRHR